MLMSAMSDNDKAIIRRCWELYPNAMAEFRLGRVEQLLVKAIRTRQSLTSEEAAAIIRWPRKSASMALASLCKRGYLVRERIAATGRVGPPEYLYRSNV